MLCHPPALTLRTVHDSAAAQVHQRAFWSTPQTVAFTYATLLACVHLGDALPQQTILGESIFILPRWPFRRNGRRPPSLLPNSTRRERLPRPTQSLACPHVRIMAVGSDLTQCALRTRRPGSIPAQPANHSDALTPRVRRQARPYGPVRPPEPSSTAQLQVTLKDNCRMVLILKSCVASSKLASWLKHAAEIFGGRAVAVPPRHPFFSHLCKSVRG